MILIAAFKLAQALLFVTVGIAALRLMHRDLPESLARLAHHLRFNPESRFIDFIMDRASLVNDKLLRRIGFSLFAYATLGTIEGIGLYLEKIWAEYLTLLITASFLPFEMFEVYKRVNLMRSSLLVINIMVFIYLLKVLIERGKLKGADKAGVSRL